MECDSKYKYLTKYFSNLMNISKKDKILYGYYLTHIILYDLKFSYQSFNELDNKENSDFAIKELIRLCSTKDILIIKDPDLLGEILFCFKLCSVNNNNLYLQIYNILSKVKPSKDYHLNVVLAGTSYLTESHKLN